MASEGGRLCHAQTVQPGITCARRPPKGAAASIPSNAGKCAHLERLFQTSGPPADVEINAAVGEKVHALRLEQLALGRLPAECETGGEASVGEHHAMARYLTG